MLTEIGQKRQFLGEILIQRDKLVRLQLEKALTLQKEIGSKIGEILVRLGYVQTMDIIAAMSQQYNLPYIYG